MSRTRRFSILAIALGAFLLASSCSSDGSSGAALTVNDERISFTEFSDELADYAEEDNTLALQSVQQQVQASDPEAAVDATSGEALAAPVAAQIATTRIAYTLVRQELADRDVEVTDEDVETARTTLSEPATDPTTGEPAEGEAAFTQLSPAMQDRFAQDTAAVSALREELTAEQETPEVTDEDVEAALAEATEQSCASIILTQTEADAAAARARVDGGEDFATVATEVSQDGSAAQGGDIGCLAEGETLPELDAALAELEPGELGGPVAISVTGQDGTAQEAFLVVQLTSRGLPTEDDLRAELQAAADEEAANTDVLGAFIVGALEEADVEVASRYGTWEPEGITLADGSSSGPTVIPPEGPEGEATTTTAAGGAGAIDPATGLPIEEAPATEGG